jgi:hypothetical protein
MKKRNVTAFEPPQVGDGATVHYHSDDEPATVIQVTHNGKRIVLQGDKAIRTDHNGMSESQSYNYERDENGAIYIATLRRDGRFRVSGGQQSVTVGSRRKYYDYSY